MAETVLKQSKRFSRVKRIIKENKDRVVKRAQRALLLFWADIIWYIHFAVVVLAIALFFVPLSIMPKRIEIHFFYLWGVIALQIIFGLLYLPRTKKFQFVCPLTAIEKHLIKRHPHKHVGESCVADFCAEKLGLPKWLGTISVSICLIMASLLYFRII